MAATIVSERRECDVRLSQYFDSRRDDWIDVVKAMVAARARCSLDNPKSSPGFLSWDAGVTRLRQIFGKRGWERGDDDGVEFVINHDLRRKVTVMNADEGVCDFARSPRNRTLKGAANEKLTDLNCQLELFKAEHPREPMPGVYQFWHLCVFDSGRTVRAELSLPIEFKSGSYIGYRERIWILGDGEWEKVTIASPVTDPPPSPYEVKVSRR